MNPYEVLGVPRNATKKQINEAFRTKSKTAHPDGGGSDEEFIELKRAHATLSDDEKRKAYDHYGIMEGDTAENDRRNMAYSFIEQIFIAIIDEDMFGDLRGADIVRSIKDARIDTLRDLSRQQDKIQSDLNKARKQLVAIDTRLKTKPGSKNIFRLLLEKRISNFESQLEPVKRCIEVMGEVEKLIEQFEFESTNSSRDAFADLLTGTFTPSGGMWNKRGF